MSTLAVTHFNNLTWQENSRWREREQYNGCIYNSPVQIKGILQNQIYVIEMNNQENKILGIGLIHNRLYYDRKYKIYSDQNYNRFTYLGKLWLPRSCIDEDTLNKLETRLFKGKKHLKRSQGIVQAPKDIQDIYLKYIDTLWYLCFSNS